MNPLIEGKRITLGYDYFATGFSGIQLSEAYYRLIADREQERLLFETATIDQIDEVYNPGDDYDENDRMTTEEMVMEAITIQRFARTESKMAALVRVFNSYLRDKGIQALAPIVGTPKKSGLFATVTVQIPFSDGQVVSIIFHSPDNNKMKITADDEIIAFRWLLNKRDITHVVSPENDAEVSLQEVGKRTAQLVEKNSARFQATQKEIVEQRKKLEELKAQAEEGAKRHDELMAALKEGQDAIEMMDTKIANLRSEIEKQKAFNDDLQGKIDALKAKQAGNEGKAAGGETPKNEAEIKAEQERAVYEDKRAALGGELTGRGFINNGGDVWNKDGFGYVQTSGADGYSITVGLADGGKKTFSSATVAGFDKQVTKALAMIDKALAEQKAATEKEEKDVKDKADKIDQQKQQGQQETKETDVIQPNEQLPDVMPISDIPSGWDHGQVTGNAVEYISGEFTVRVTRYDEGENKFRVTLSENRQVIAYKDAKSLDESNIQALEMMQNKDSLKATYLEEVKKNEPPETSEPAAVGVLNDILAGKYDGDSTKLGEALDQAAADLEKDGKAEQYDALLNQAADYLSDILKKEAA